MIYNLSMYHLPVNTNRDKKKENINIKTQQYMQLNTEVMTYQRPWGPIASWGRSVQSSEKYVAAKKTLS